MLRISLSLNHSSAGGLLVVVALSTQGDAVRLHLQVFLAHHLFVMLLGPAFILTLEPAGLSGRASQSCVIVTFIVEGCEGSWSIHRGLGRVIRHEGVLSHAGLVQVRLHAMVLHILRSESPMRYSSLPKLGLVCFELKFAGSYGSFIILNFLVQLI